MTRWPPSSGCAWSPTRTGGVHRATRLARGHRHRVTGTSVDSARAATSAFTSGPGTDRADEWPRRTSARTSVVRSPSSCASSSSARSGMRSFADPRRRASSSSSGCSAVAGWKSYQGPAGREGGRGHCPLAELGVSEDRRRSCDAGQDGGRQGLRTSTSTRRQKIPYDQAPPSYGAHWPNFLQGSEIRTFYSPAATGPRSSGWCTASSTATRSSGTTRRVTAGSPGLQGHPGDRRQVRRRDRQVHGGPVEGGGRRLVPRGQARRADALDRSRRPRRASRSTAVRPAVRSSSSSWRDYPASSAPEPDAP